MAQFSVKTGQIRPLAGDESKMAQELSGYADSIGRIANSLNFHSGAAAGIRARLKSASQKTASHRAGMSGLSSALTAIMDRYDDAERRIANRIGEQSGQSDVWNDFLSELGKNYGWKEALKGSNYIGKIYNFIDDIKNNKSGQDWIKTGKDACDFLSGAVYTYKNYGLIGRAVGKQTAMSWWFKHVTGLKPLGRVSSARNPITRFANNLTNKTSPFNAQIRNNLNNFTGANGVGRATASWAGVAVSGLLNWQANKEEQINSNGTMSDGRVLAETITETAVDTVFSIAGTAAVGAAVSAICPVAVPGVLVVAASGLLIAGANAGVQALTGKTGTEWISDTIVDAGEGIGKAVDATAKWVFDGGAEIGKNVGNAASKIGSSIAKWFSKKS